MVDPAECERLRHRATEVLLHLVRDGGFHRAELFWSELARSSKATLTVVDAHGASAMVKTPNELFDILEDLRSEMADPGTGAWLSTNVWVDIEGDGGFDFNYDRRPYWSSPDPFVPTDRDRVDPNPADEAFLEDLVDHPRSADQLPPWYPTGRNDTATPTSGPGRLVGAALFPSGLVSLATSADWVGIADAVRRHLTAVIAENPSAAGAALVQQTYERVFGELLEPRTAEVVKRIWAPANAAARYPPKSTLVPDDELVAQPSETLEILLEDISDVIADIAEHQLPLLEP